MSHFVGFYIMISMVLGFFCWMVLKNSTDKKERVLFARLTLASVVWPLIIVFIVGTSLRFLWKEAKLGDIKSKTTHKWQK